MALGLKGLPQSIIAHGHRVVAQQGTAVDPAAALVLLQLIQILKQDILDLPLEFGFAGHIQVFHLPQADKLLENLKKSQLAQMVEVVDTDGSIDLDTIRDMLKAQIERQGSMTIENVPILKKLVFKAEDVDKAYEFIMRG